ncbi:transcription initiation factor TFIID subunit A-domain-containing protein [Lipomyces chichibuensis]|uniref:transcription initiation factor TFIID subunit A-domain-containing protein n=1 Tax=Lipomyces chichibuensis TaxID=1546026 RepID=UPI0033430F9A
MSAQQQQGMKDGPQSSPQQQQDTQNLHQQLPFQAQHGRGQQNMIPQVGGAGRGIPIPRQGGSVTQMQEPFTRLSQQYQLEMQQARSFGMDTAEGKQAMARAAKIKEYARRLQASSQQYMAQNPQQAQAHATQLTATQQQQQLAAAMQRTPVMQQQRLPPQGQASATVTPQQSQQSLPPSAGAMAAARTPQQQQQLKAAQAAQFANMSPAQQHSVRMNHFNHVNKYVQQSQAQINAHEKYLNENPGISPEERAKVQQYVRELTVKREQYVLMAKSLAQQIRLSNPQAQMDQQHQQQQPSQQAQLAQMQKPAIHAGQGQPLTTANLMSQLAAVQQNNPQMTQSQMQQSLPQQPAGNKQMQMQTSIAQRAQQQQSQIQAQAMQNSQKGFPIQQSNLARPPGVVKPPQSLTPAQQQAFQQQQLLQQQNQQAVIQSQQQRMQPQNAPGRAVSPQNPMQSPLAAQPGLTGAQRAQAIRAGATPNSNLSPRLQATALSGIPAAAAAAAATASAAARTGSPAIAQGSPMARQATSAQQRLQQQQTPAQQQAIQAAVGQTPQTPQSPAGPSARPVLTQQPIMNGQNIFNPSASVINQMPIPTTLSIKQPTPASVKPARPSLSGGHAANSPIMTSPAVMKPPSFELNGGVARVLSKRKLSELVKDMIGTSSSINGVPLLGDERDTSIDGDVEELLLDLADEFVTSVASFSCRLAKHRKSNTLDVKDVQLHLERNWNIRIPGYNADEIRSVRRWNPTQSYLQKLSGVNTSRAISGK